MNDENTINLIINQKKSLARFGDGEFKWMLGIKQNSFQDDNKLLKERLLELINCSDNNLLIGIPNALNSTKEYNYSARLFWKIYLRRYIKIIYPYLNFNNTYANTNITRPYIDYRDKSECEKRFDNLKSIWNEKDVIIVEGEMSKLGMGNDLFSNTKSLKRIICPSKNAFDKYDEILKCILKQDKNKLILLSLGPTATILASDLCNNGYQALDIGHIDIEYEWFKMGAKEKKEIKGKFVNEAKNKNIEKYYYDDLIYNKSIIRKIL